MSVTVVWPQFPNVDIFSVASNWYTLENATGLRICQNKLKWVLKINRLRKYENAGQSQYRTATGTAAFDTLILLHLA